MLICYLGRGEGTGTPFYVKHKPPVPKLSKTKAVLTAGTGPSIGTSGPPATRRRRKRRPPSTSTPCPVFLVPSRKISKVGAFIFPSHHCTLRLVYMFKKKNRARSVRPWTKVRLTNEKSSVRSFSRGQRVRQSGANSCPRAAASETVSWLRVPMDLIKFCF